MKKKMTPEMVRGYYNGNYANSYETDDYDYLLSSITDTAVLPNESFADFMNGLLLGFFASYEIHEISCEYADEVEWLRSEYDV